MLIAIKQELTNVDVLVCGLCHIGFHFVEEFQEHKDGRCNKISSYRDQNSTVIINLILIKMLNFLNKFTLNFLIISRYLFK